MLFLVLTMKGQKFKVLLMADEALPSPAEYIRRELQRRGMTQLDLAFVLGVPQQAVNQIALGKRGISAALAKDLGAVFGVAAEYLLQLQKASEVGPELRRARDTNPDVARKATIIATYPLRDMIKRGWLRADRDSLEEQLASFLGVATLDDDPHLIHAAKKTEPMGAVSASQQAWIARVRNIARRQIVAKYSEKSLREAVAKMRALLVDPNEISRVPRLMSEAGVRFVLVEGFAGGKIDGVTLWLDSQSPVIGLSIRLDRIDNAWFVIRHEIEHVLKRHGGGHAPMIDTDLHSDGAAPDVNISEEEREANAAASDFCVPKAKMDSFFARKSPFFSELDMLGFSKLMQVHPGLVAGQLRHRTGRYDLFAKFLVKVRSAIVKTAVVDGWGETYPT
jgi:HTH-type transcriptional regulator/antitoxin HigA